MSSAKTQRTGNTFVLFKRNSAPLALFAALCLLLSACLPDGKDKVYTKKIADETFQIPKAYFHRFRPDPNVESLYFAVLYPEFKPLEKPRDEYWHAGRGDDVITFIIENAENLIPITEHVEKAKTTFAGHNFSGEFNGLEKWDSGPSDEKDNELYVYRESGQTVGFLLCHRESAYEDLDHKVNPRCTGKFRKFGVAIDISFDKDHFDQWPDIRDKSFRLISGFRVDDK